MADIDRQSLRHSVEVVGEPWRESAYYDDAEAWLHVFWGEGTQFRRLFDQLDLDAVVELACGHGRHAELVAPRAGRLTLIDIFDENLTYCRNRLKVFSNVDYIMGDGFSFKPLPNACATAIFCCGLNPHA